MALTAATDVTLALKRTHQLLEQELEKSTISLATLDHSSQTLRQLEQQYSGFDVLLKGSKRLIIELERADYWDRWLIYIGLTIFGLTCLWITYKRILRGPLGLMIWVGRKVFSASSSPLSLTKSVSATKSLTSSISQETIEAVSTPLLSHRDEL
jgi:protein transport protein SEC20